MFTITFYFLIVAYCQWLFGPHPRINVLFVPAGDIAALDRIGPQTEQRLEKALSLWATDDFAWIVVTGGITVPSNVQTVGAGKLMAQWLVERGVPQQVIISEIFALDSYENALFALYQLRDRGVRLSRIRVCLSTQLPHSLRFGVAFAARGVSMSFAPVAYARTKKWWIQPVVLEPVFLLVHLVDWYGIGPVARLNRTMRRQPRRPCRTHTSSGLFSGEL